MPSSTTSTGGGRVLLPLGLGFTGFGITGTSTVYIERDDTGTPLGTDVAGTETAYATDGLGTITNLVGASGTATSTYTYTPSGQQSGKTAGDTNLLGYTGALTDPTTTNLYLSHRYYTPTQGSFTQQDTNTKLADPTNGNLYTYASDNPTNYTDPTGQDFWSSVEDVGETVLSDVGSCLGGAVDLEGATAPAQPWIAATPVVGEISETAIPLAGCAGGMASSTYLGSNLL